MAWHLALRNVRRAYRDFLVYFLTLAFSVCLFYLFNSFQAQQAMMELSESGSTALVFLSGFMKILSILIAIVLAFLILYAGSFLIRRRKKELGLYLLLGMSRTRVSRILITETFLVGILSLGIGLILGVFLSQGMAVLTASIFHAKLNYGFVFSVDAVGMTVVSFGVIFLCMMIFQTLMLGKNRLVDLLYASCKQEKQRIRQGRTALVLMILSLALLGFAYWMAVSSPSRFVSLFLMILAAGTVGTILFFFSLSRLLPAVLKRIPGIYHRGLNLFVYRQISAKVNTGFLSMSIVCLMLLLSIGALGVGVSLYRLAEGIEEMPEIQALFLFIGIYLGIVFLLAGGVIPALQQLADTEDNRERYEILRKIGVEKKEMRRAIVRQNAWSFLLPLFLAAIHALFGIPAVLSTLNQYFETTQLIASGMVTGGVILLIYGIYFLASCRGCQAILEEKRR